MLSFTGSPWHTAVCFCEGGGAEWRSAEQVQVPARQSFSGRVACTPVQCHSFTEMWDYAFSHHSGLLVVRVGRRRAWTRGRSSASISRLRFSSARITSPDHICDQYNYIFAVEEEQSREES